jgi:hypothetical protein
MIPKARLLHLGIDAGMSIQDVLLSEPGLLLDLLDLHYEKDGDI